ncbi:hypothetical protein [Halococcus agarilyticus]|uniref:hypothetical protein n=1 Tax=Halococcus agarilyticus TaxID=1232219 RepID=UPI0012ABE28C|nr:hypothetical protein [Halococcus agarilyticus]
MVDWSVPASEASNKRLLYEIAIGLLVMISPIIQLAEKQAISRIGIGFGVLAIVLIYAFSRTSLGNRLEKWFRQIEVGGRTIVIITVVPIIMGGLWLLKPPAVPTFSFIIGSMGTIIVATILRILSRLNSRRQEHPA